MELFVSANKTLSTKTLPVEHALTVCLPIPQELLVFVKIALAFSILILSSVSHSQKIASLVKITLALNVSQVTRKKTKHVSTLVPQVLSQILPENVSVLVETIWKKEFVKNQ